MVGAVAEVVEASFCISKKSTGGSAHAVAVGTFNDVGCGKEGGTADRVVFGTRPESKDHEIGFVGLPPTGVTNVEGGRPENGIILNV